MPPFTGTYSKRSGGSAARAAAKPRGSAVAPSPLLPFVQADWKAPPREAHSVQRQGSRVPPLWANRGGSPGKANPLLAPTFRCFVAAPPPPPPSWFFPIHPWDVSACLFASRCFPAIHPRGTRPCKNTGASPPDGPRSTFSNPHELHRRWPTCCSVFLPLSRHNPPLSPLRVHTYPLAIRASRTNRRPLRTRRILKCKYCVPAHELSADLLAKLPKTGECKTCLPP